MIIVIVICLGLLTNFVVCDVSPISFFSTLGGSSNEYAYSVQQTTDGGYVTTGYTESFGAGDRDILLAKYFSSGALEWARALGGSEYDTGRSVQQTTDGGFVVTGQTQSYGALGNDALLAKYFSNGDVDWVKTLHGSVEDLGRAVQQTTDGGYIFTGYSNSFGVYYAILLAKYDSDGTLDWAKTIGGDGGSDLGHGVQQTTDGGYIVTGEVSSFGIGSIDVLLAKFFPNGTVEWAKALGGINMQYGVQVQQTSDGGFVVTGCTSSAGAGSTDLLLAKFFSDGSLEWVKALGGKFVDHGRSVQQTTDGGYIVTGQSKLENIGDIILAKYDSDGTLDWAKTLGGSGEEYGYSVQQTTDGGYIVAGEGQSFGAGGTDVFLSYVRSDGSGVCLWESCDLCNATDISSYLTLNDWSISSVDMTGSFNTSTIYPTLSVIGVDSANIICGNYYECFGILGNETGDVCGGHGDCSSDLICGCQEGYFGTTCNVTQCYGVFTNQSTQDICSGNGECTAPDNCVCENEGYEGDECDVWYCGDFLENDDEVCGSHGDCIGIDHCLCDEGFSSTSATEHCDIWYCGEKRMNDEDVCSGRGVCESSHFCECESSDYGGSLCQTWSCGSDDQSLAEVCSGNGECTGPNECSCHSGYVGDHCDSSLYSTVMAPTLSLTFLFSLGFLFLFCLCCCCSLVSVVFGLVVLVVVIRSAELRVNKFKMLKKIDNLIRKQDREEGGHGKDENDSDEESESSDDELESEGSESSDDDDDELGIEENGGDELENERSSDDDERIDERSSDDE